jgi:hypothetical protein
MTEEYSYVNWAFSVVSRFVSVSFLVLQSPEINLAHDIVINIIIMQEERFCRLRFVIWFFFKSWIPQIYQTVEMDEDEEGAYIFMLQKWVRT